MSDNQPILHSSRDHDEIEDGHKRRSYGTAEASRHHGGGHGNNHGYDHIPDSESEPPTGCWGQIAHWLHVNKTVSEVDKELRRQGSCGWFYCEWRDHLGEFIEHKYVQYILISLLVLDVVLLAVDLGLEEVFHNTEDHYILMAEHALKWASIGILCIFGTEVILLVIAFDFTFFLHPLYVMDAVIVGVAFLIELWLQDVLVAGFLIILRLWRVVRIIHSIIMMEENSHSRTKEELHHLQSEFTEQEEELKNLRAELKETQTELQHWKDLYEGHKTD